MCTPTNQPGLGRTPMCACTSDNKALFFPPTLGIYVGYSQAYMYLAKIAVHIVRSQHMQQGAGRTRCKEVVGRQNITCSGMHHTSWSRRHWMQVRAISLPNGSTPVIIVAATLFVVAATLFQSPTNVPRFLSLIWSEMCLLCWERAMCAKKAKKDVPAAVVSRAACVSRAPPDDASRPALVGWGRPAWSLCVNLLSTIFQCWPPAQPLFVFCSCLLPISSFLQTYT